MNIKDCFDAARAQFIQENQALILDIERESSLHAKNLGLSENEFLDSELCRHFVSYLQQFGVDKDAAVTVIKMYAPNETVKKDLLIEHLSKVASSIGLSLEEYLDLNRMDINSL
ncbi:DUF6388 family protein [Pectobacterium polaris]|uniref:DUF6388 family protein n=1 Tax=Pectobacterium polaris TaxID=2042057 RepID=UPI0032E428BA